MRRRIVLMLLAVMVAMLVVAQAAFAGGKAHHCNAGNGNGPEPPNVTINGITNDCDPGNSGTHNADNVREGLA